MSQKFQPLPPLDQVTKPNLTTDEAAHYLNRSEATLRWWACQGKGAVVPLRINGRLAWPVSQVKKVVGGAA